jgi:hypothetical protein
MEPKGILKSPRLHVRDVPTYDITDLVRRQAGGGTRTDTTALPIGAIIGIAIVCSAILFGVLTTIIMCFLRSHHKKKKRPRDLDLSDEYDDDMRETLRSTRPPDIGLEIRTSHNTSHSATGSLPKEWPEPRFYGPQLDNPKTMPPAYAFQITGLRDSWPLIGWVQSQPDVSQSVNKHPVVNSASIDRRTSYSAFVLSAENEPAWPQPALSRPNSFTRGIDRRSVQWSNHSAKSSVTSFKSFLGNRKSMSDSQLTSILRSTSQRLRDAQRRPMSRSMSVLSQVSGAPPAAQPLSPPKDIHIESREALIDTDDVSLIDSVRSSVLNTISQTPSPQKINAKTKELIKGTIKGSSPTTSEASEADSLCPSKTPDLFIPAALSSPSKRGVRANQRYGMTISSTKNPPTRTIRDNGEPLVVLVDGDMTARNYSSNSIPSGNDPFLSVDATTKAKFNSKTIKGPRPLIKRNNAVQPHSKTDGDESIFSSLRPVSGNPQSPTKLKPPATTSITETQPNPFHWSPQCSPSSTLSPSHKPTGIRQRGHKRSRTVRLSNLPRPASVSVVLEEPENGTTPPRTDLPVEIPAIYPSSLEMEISGLRSSSQNNIRSTRPPSIPVFQPFLAVPSTTATTDGTRPSDSSYSATMSFYDYYSTGDPFKFNQLGVPGPSQSPTPSTKKARRWGCNFSVDITKARDSALLDASAAVPPSARPQSPPNSGPSQFLTLDTSNDPPTAPAFISHLYAPSSPPRPEIKDSITASISMLRRMNSEVSAYSTGSLRSDHSNGSPTIPGLRGGGLSPTKRGSQATMNYLSIGVKTPSPKARRARRRDSTLRDTARDYHQSLLFEGGIENYNALGLKMPILEHSPPKLPSFESLHAIERQEDQSPTQSRNKAIMAQLRPMSISTPQDRVTEILEADEQANEKEQQDATDEGWSNAMSTPLKKSVRHESQLEMPSAQGLSPKSKINWRGSLGLYDEMGFLKSSPERP